MTVDPATINHIPGSAKRYASLDAVRGIAALSVVFFHSTWPVHPFVTSFSHNLYTAVDLFFLMSGFVIAASYESRVATAGQVLGFFERRIFRIYPLQWAVLSWLTLLELAKLVSQLHGHGLGTHNAFTGTNSLGLLVANALLIQGTGLFSQTSWNPHSWSVSAEVVAYILFASGGYVGLLRRRWLLMTLSLLGLAAYAALAVGWDTLNLAADYGIVRCLAGFTIGVTLYVVTAKRTPAWLDRLTFQQATLLEVLTVTLAMLVLVVTTNAAIVLVIPCFIALVTLFQLERGWVSIALRARMFQYLGAISYSIYLVQFSVRNVLVNALAYAGVRNHVSFQSRMLDISQTQGDLLLLGFLIATVGVAAVTFRFIEEPARLFGRRLHAAAAVSKGGGSSRPPQPAAAE